MRKMLFVPSFPSSFPLSPVLNSLLNSLLYWSGSYFLAPSPSSPILASFLSRPLLIYGHHLQLGNSRPFRVRLTLGVWHFFIFS